MALRPPHVGSLRLLLLLHLWDNALAAGTREMVILANCLLQGVAAGILIQANLYAGNMAGKQKFSVPCAPPAPLRTALSALYIALPQQYVLNRTCPVLAPTPAGPFKPSHNHLFSPWPGSFVILVILLAVNIGSCWEWKALGLSLPGAVLIILGQKTVFGARKRGDYTMKNAGKAKGEFKKRREGQREH